MFSLSNNLFYVVFLSQIFLLSYYFPQKMLDRMQHVLDSCPPTAYPKLYPRPLEHYKFALWAFKTANRVILALGLVILLAIIFVVDHSTFAADGFISEAWPAVYGLIQFIPAMVLEFSECSHVKLMRKANASSKRKAELRRRGLFDFVSPLLALSAVALYAASIWFDFYAHDYVLDWGHDTVERTMVLTATNLFLAAFGAWTLYASKKDPYQSLQNRAQRVGASLRSLFYVSMAMSVYFAFTAADDLYDLEFADAIALSLYFQVIVFLSIGHYLRSIKLEEIDFDVYRGNAARP